MDEVDKPSGSPGPTHCLTQTLWRQGLAIPLHPCFGVPWMGPREALSWEREAGRSPACVGGAWCPTSTWRPEGDRQKHWEKAEGAPGWAGVGTRGAPCSCEANTFVLQAIPERPCPWVRLRAWHLVGLLLLH